MMHLQLANSFMTPDIWLFVQVLAAILGLVSWFGLICPNRNASSDRSLLVDVWWPMSASLPLAALVWTNQGQVNDTHWYALGSPLILASCAVGVGLFRIAQSQQEQRQFSVFPGIAWTTCGIGLLMLGAVHTLTVWVGQCLFPIIALIMWVNAPPYDGKAARPAPDRSEHRISFGSALLVVAAILHAVAASQCDEQTITISSLIAVGVAIVLVTSMMILLSANECVRSGGWIGCYAVLIALGLMSLRHMIPGSLASLGLGPAPLEPPIADVSVGFGRFAWEAMIFVAAGVVLLCVRLWKGRISSAVATLALALAAISLGVFRMIELLNLTSP